VEVPACSVAKVLVLAAGIAAGGCSRSEVAAHPAPLRSTNRPVESSPAGRPTPVLHLSADGGAAGTRVRVIATNCKQPEGQGDSLFWHDSYQLSDRSAKPPYRRVTRLRRRGLTVWATFVVHPTDHQGVGLLDLLCGGPQNATARFRVVRP
jgi:hypothetical protein